MAGCIWIGVVVISSSLKLMNQRRSELLAVFLTLTLTVGLSAAAGSTRTKSDRARRELPFQTMHGALMLMLSLHSPLLQITVDPIAPPASSFSFPHSFLLFSPSSFYFSPSSDHGERRQGSWLPAADPSGAASPAAPP